MGPRRIPPAAVPLFVSRATGVLGGKRLGQLPRHGNAGLLQDMRAHDPRDLFGQAVQGALCGVLFLGLVGIEQADEDASTKMLPLLQLVSRPSTSAPVARRRSRQPEKAAGRIHLCRTSIGVRLPVVGENRMDGGSLLESPDSVNSRSRLLARDPHQRFYRPSRRAVSAEGLAVGRPTFPPAA